MTLSKYIKDVCMGDCIDALRNLIEQDDDDTMILFERVIDELTSKLSVEEFEDAMDNVIEGIIRDENDLGIEKV